MFVAPLLAQHGRVADFFLLPLFLRIVTSRFSKALLLQWTKKSGGIGYFGQTSSGFIGKADGNVDAQRLHIGLQGIEFE